MEKKNSDSRPMKGLAAIVVTLLGLTLAVATVYRTTSRIRNRLTFVPTKGQPLPEPSIPFQNKKIRTSDGETLHGWYMPQENASLHKLILFFHGNGGNLGDYLYSFLELYKLKYNIFAVDYRGYGLSTGEPSERGILHDAQAVLSYAQNEMRFFPDRIVVYGFSMGTVPATWLASEFKVGGLVVHNGFTTILDVAKAHKIVPLLDSFSFVISTLFRPADYIVKTTCPVLVVHSRQDELCPFSLGEDLFHAVTHSAKHMVELEGLHSKFVFSDDFRHHFKRLFPSTG